MKNVTSCCPRTRASLRCRLPLLIAAAALACLPSSARAVSLVSTLGQTDNLLFALSSSANFFATDFLTGPAATSVTSFTLLLRNSDSNPRTVAGEIWSDNGGNPGRPGSLLDTFDTPITLPDFGFSFANHSGTDPGISLAPNTIYWLVFHVGETGAAPVFMDSTSGQEVNAGGLFSGVPSSQFNQSFNSGATWNFASAFLNTPIYELAGEVVSSGGGRATSVPDTGSNLSLLGLAFASLMWFRRARGE